MVIYVYLYMYTYIHRKIYMYYTYIHTYINTHIYMHMYIYTHIYIYTYMSLGYLIWSRSIGDSRGYCTTLTNPLQLKLEWSVMMLLLDLVVTLLCLRTCAWAL